MVRGWCGSSRARRGVPRSVSPGWKSLPRLVGAIAVVSVGLVSGCSSDPSPDSAASVTSAAGDGRESDRSGSPLPVETTALSTTTAPPLDLGSVELTDEQRACIVARLPADVDAAEVPGDLAAEALGQCGRAESFGSAFAENLSGDLGLAEADVECLAVGFGELTNEQVDALISAGADVTSDAAAEAESVMSELFDSCGVPKPAP